MDLQSYEVEFTRPFTPTCNGQGQQAWRRQSVLVKEIIAA
jgi:hypothetical protein